VSPWVNSCQKATVADLELLTVGRVSVDLYAEQLGVPLRAVRTFRKSVGGTATNVAVAAARLGRRAAVLTKVGDDPFGDYVRWALADTFGVDTRFVGLDATLPTPLAFAELDPPDDPRIIFYRHPKAPDMNLEPDDVDLDVVRRVPLLWVSLGALSADPSRSTVHQLLADRGRGGETIVDLDWRPQMWDSPASATREVGRALGQATLAIGNRAECEIAVGTDDPDLAAERLLDRGLRGAMVKLGAGGVLVATADGVRERVPPYPVDVVCGLGAGDAFGGAICHGLLSGWDLVQCARHGNAAGAIVAGRLMCADDMPTPEEIEDVLAGAVGGRASERQRAARRWGSGAQPSRQYGVGSG
jgi:5-dehydro-2-deoxygluconokinase